MTSHTSIQQYKTWNVDCSTDSVGFLTCFTMLLQILNEASQLALTNFKNHVSTNFERRTKAWIMTKLRAIQFIRTLSTSNFNSWVRLVYWAGTTVATTAAQLLPKYTSLDPPPAPVLSAVEGLVTIMHSRIGVLPVTDTSLSDKSGQYLKWLHFILKDFEALHQAAQEGQRLPRLFSLLPQKSNQTAFITISTSSLHM